MQHTNGETKDWTDNDTTAPESFNNTGEVGEEKTNVDSDGEQPEDLGQMEESGSEEEQSRQELTPEDVEHINQCSH
jgi:hypothetical protein